MARNKKTAIRLYDVSSAIEFILDETKSPYLRAICLYETQIAVSFGEKLNRRQMTRKVSPAQWLAVPENVLASACLCSSIRLLQYIQSNRQLNGTSSKDLIDNQDARDVLNHILLTPDGLKKIATAYRPKILDAKLRNRRRRQRRYAPLYDVSLRWPEVSGSTLRGGWSTALQLFRPKIGTDAHSTVRKYYPGLRGRSSAYKFKDRGDYLAAFVWLRHYRGGLFRPRQLSRASFAKRLLADVLDVPRLIEFFGRYEFIRGQLIKRGYKLLPLAQIHQVRPIEIAISPLPEELLEAVSSVRSES
ncbi:hypothetical protein [Methylobacterium sp. Leaf111]|uniref:hypothetical protein n=1 Tax=Methylobacterium sp. Leaf111 TaxID=1736257 RepID=UPI000A6AD325|nr:hypothetical protein [Methylobacterium sp. Leaf111]